MDKDEMMAIAKQIEKAYSVLYWEILILGSIIIAFLIPVAIQVLGWLE